MEIQEVTSRSFLRLFPVLHARHATFYIFYAKFPNTYLRDIMLHGAAYKSRVSAPAQIIIQQSRPFRMRKPKDNAELFKLFSKVLYYIVSGNGRIGYLAAEKWNTYYLVAQQAKDREQSNEKRKDDVWEDVTSTNF